MFNFKRVNRRFLNGLHNSIDVVVLAELKFMLSLACLYRESFVRRR